MRDIDMLAIHRKLCQASKALVPKGEPEPWQAQMYRWFAVIASIGILMLLPPLWVFIIVSVTTLIAVAVLAVTRTTKF